MDGLKTEQVPVPLERAPTKRKHYVFSKDMRSVYEVTDSGWKRIKDKHLAQELFKQHMANKDKQAAEVEATKARVEQEIAVKAIAASIRSEPSRIITEE